MGRKKKRKKREKEKARGRKKGKEEGREGRKESEREREKKGREGGREGRIILQMGQNMKFYISFFELPFLQKFIKQQCNAIFPHICL